MHCITMSSACTGPKGALDPLELELQRAESLCMLGTELRSGEIEPSPQSFEFQSFELVLPVLDRGVWEEQEAAQIPGHLNSIACSSCCSVSG